MTRRLKSVKIPAQIGQKDCFINTEIVDENIPLLLSKTSLKKANTTLNLSNDEIKMFHQKIQTKNSFNGYYSILILPDPTSNLDEMEEVLIFEDNDTLGSKQKKNKKLHRQFGYASSNNLKFFFLRGKTLKLVKN